MRGMPLLMCAKKPMLGPMVPTIDRLTKVRADGLVPSDRVAVYGWKGKERTTLKDILDAAELVLEIRSDLYDYIQVELFNQSQGLYLWIE